MRTILFGAEAGELRDLVERQPSLQLVTANPELVICYGGDGTLLSAEARWPGIPKLPIRNSRRGNRCIPHPPATVIDRLVGGGLTEVRFLKLEAQVRPAVNGGPGFVAHAMNEFNVHMARINSAVRFVLTLDGEPYLGGREVLGDGLIVSTPFGSTAYFNQLTRGVFHAGVGIAFKSTSEHTDHLVVSEDTRIAITITRGPAVLAHDNCTEFTSLQTGDELLLRKHEAPAILYTWAPVRQPSEAF